MEYLIPRFTRANDEDFYLQNSAFKTNKHAIDDVGRNLYLTSSR